MSNQIARYIKWLTIYKNSEQVYKNLLFFKSDYTASVQLNQPLQTSWQMHTREIVGASLPYLVNREIEALGPIYFLHVFYHVYNTRKKVQSGGKPR